MYIHIYICAFVATECHFLLTLLNTRALSPLHMCFIFLRCTCLARKEILKLNTSAVQLFPGMMSFWLPVSFVEKRSIKSSDSRSGGTKESATTMIRSLLLLSPLVVLVAFTTWGVNPELILGLQFVKHHDCQGGLPPWLS